MHVGIFDGSEYPTDTDELRPHDITLVDSSKNSGLVYQFWHALRGSLRCSLNEVVVIVSWPERTEAPRTEDFLELPGGLIDFRCGSMNLRPPAISCDPTGVGLKDH